jgi:hypothetical protein
MVKNRQEAFDTEPRRVAAYVHQEREPQAGWAARPWPDVERQIAATLYVGDQLARIADVLEDVTSGGNGGLVNVRTYSG